LPLYEIGGLKTWMEPQRDPLKTQAERYRIVGNESDCQIRAVYGEEEWEGIFAQYKRYPVGSVEYLKTGSLFYTKALSYGCFYLHSSAVVLDGFAYLFSAPSGTGKSTHARLWNKLAKAEYINDDQPYYKMGEQIVVYPSPWSGKHKRYSTSSAPLKAFIVIKQAKQNKIYKVDKKSALSYLYKQIVQHDEDELRIKMLEYMQKIVEQIPFYLLECDVSSLAFITCFEEVTGEKYEN